MKHNSERLPRHVGPLFPADASRSRPRRREPISAKFMARVFRRKSLARARARAAASGAPRGPHKRNTNCRDVTLARTSAPLMSRNFPRARADSIYYIIISRGQRDGRCLSPRSRAVGVTHPSPPSPCECRPSARRPRDETPTGAPCRAEERAPSVQACRYIRESANLRANKFRARARARTCSYPGATSRSRETLTSR